MAPGASAAVDLRLRSEGLGLTRRYNVYGDNVPRHPLMEIPNDIILCAIGAALCIFGWMLYWGGLHALGAVAGFAAGAVLGYLAVEAVVAAQDQIADIARYRVLILVVCGAIGALFGLFLLRRIHFGALAIAGAVLGLAVGLQLLSVLRAREIDWVQGQHITAIAAAVGVVGGALVFVFFHRWVIIVVTSVAGAAMLEIGVGLATDLAIAVPALILALLFQAGVVRRLGLGKERRRSQDKKDQDE